MTQTLAQLLTDSGADPTTLQHAVRYAVAELSEYASSTEMRAKLSNRFESQSAMETALNKLSTDGDALLDVDLAVLAALWAEGDAQETVRQSISEAKDRLPVVEGALISLVAMYGMFLVSTGGRRRTIRKISRTKDGWTEEEQIEFQDFSAPVKGLSAAMGLDSGTQDESEDEPKQE